MAEVNYKALGLRIRKARQQKKMTQDKLAEACGLSTAHIGHIERGSRIPSLSALFQIACELDVSTDYLLMDSAQDPRRMLSAVWAGLAHSREDQISKFLSAVKALADKVDDL